MVVILSVFTVVMLVIIGPNRKCLQKVFGASVFLMIVAILVSSELSRRSEMKVQTLRGLALALAGVLTLSGSVFAQATTTEPERI